MFLIIIDKHNNKIKHVFGQFNHNFLLKINTTINYQILILNNAFYYLWQRIETMIIHKLIKNHISEVNKVFLIPNCLELTNNKLLQLHRILLL